MEPTPRHPLLITTPKMMTVDHDADSPVSDGSGGHGLNSKSRNARAQARHRAKRKAYIEQLEASVNSLTETLNDLKQRGIDDPSSLRFMALEADNSQLRHENAQLRMENNHFRDQLADAVRSTPPKISSQPTNVDDYGYPREGYKRRKRSADESFLMASQTPGAIRGEAHGSCMTHQMAAGDAQVTHPRFDAHYQRDVQQHHIASIGGLSPHDIPPPQSSDYAQGTQPQSQYRSPMVPPLGPNTLPPFVSQKSSAESLYSLQYSEQPNMNPASQPQQNYAGQTSSPLEPQHHRPGSSGSSVDSSQGGGWPAMYTMHPTDQPQQRLPPQQLPHPQQRMQQPQQHLPIASYPTLAHDARNPHLYHVSATM